MKSFFAQLFIYILILRFVKRMQYDQQYKQLSCSYF